VYRRAYRLLLDHAHELRTSADALAVCVDDDEARELLASLGQRDRSSTVRYGDSEERRAHLDRIVERLTIEDETNRFAELSRSIDEMFEMGKSIPGELMGEFERLKLKLKK
jgi:hypothetical protein